MYTRWSGNFSFVISKFYHLCCRKLVFSGSVRVLSACLCMYCRQRLVSFPQTPFGWLSRFEGAWFWNPFTPTMARRSSRDHSCWRSPFTECCCLGQLGRFLVCQAHWYLWSLMFDVCVTQCHLFNALCLYVLVHRHDLELQLSCYNASEEKDKQTSTCNWPPEVTIGINDHTLPVDKVRSLTPGLWSIPC